MNKQLRQQVAFTLIELLVVIAIIALLMTMVVPALIRVKERARRTVCQSTIRSFHLAIVAYASGNDDFVPQGGHEGKDFIVVLDRSIYEPLTDSNFDAFVCPNLFNPYQGGIANIFHEDSYITDIDAHLLGYNYLGGFQDTPWPLKDSTDAKWNSPQKISDSPRIPIITELNSWALSPHKMTFAPHGYWGPIHESKDSTNESSNGAASDKIGSVGGNICTTDGAINWKDIEDMRSHTGALNTGVDLFAYW